MSGRSLNFSSVARLLAEVGYESLDNVESIEVDRDCLTVHELWWKPVLAGRGFPERTTREFPIDRSA